MPGNTYRGYHLSGTVCCNQWMIKESTPIVHLFGNNWIMLNLRCLRCNRVYEIMTDDIADIHENVPRMVDGITLTINELQEYATAQ